MACWRSASPMRWSGSAGRARRGLGLGRAPCVRPPGGPWSTVSRPARAVKRPLRLPSPGSPVYLLVGRVVAVAADLTHAPMMDAAAFLAELEPVTARLLDRHLAQAKEWFPHQLVPYSRGRDFEPRLRVVARGHPAVRRGAVEPVRQPPHRGQPAVLLPHDRGHVRPRLGVGRVEPPVDGRRGPPLDRHPRLPHGHPGPRPGGARAGPHGPGVVRPGARARDPAGGPRLRGAARARHPHLAPQHRQGHRRPGRLRGHEAGGVRREPPPPLLPRPVHRRPRGRPVGHGRRHRDAGARVRDARHRASSTSTPTPAPSPGPASTTSRSTTTRSSRRSSCATGASRT